MSSIRFYLKNPRSSKPTSIYMVLCYGGCKEVGGARRYTPFKYYVGERIAPRHWSGRLCRAGVRAHAELHAELNRRLSHVEHTAQCALLRLKNSGREVTHEALREALDRALKRGRFRRPAAPTFLQFAEEYVAEVREAKSCATVRQYENTLRLLRRFAKEAGALDFEDVDLRFHARLKRYMLRQGLSEAYFGAQVKVVKLLMNEATERGYCTQQRYRSKKFACPAVEPQKIYLTEAELERWRGLDLRAQPSLERVRDAFYVACKTGLRFSDLRRVRAKNFSPDGKILHLKTQKTGAVVHIPLCAAARALCIAYGYALPCVSSQHFNKCLKRVAQLAGISGAVELRVGAKTVVRKRHELVCTHTARRSFATNAYLAGIPSIAIMRITGHATEKAFMRYIRVEGESNAQQLLQHPYFG